jgi:hypothetical protein
MADASTPKPAKPRARKAAAPDPAAAADAEAKPAAEQRDAPARRAPKRRAPRRPAAPAAQAGSAGAESAGAESTPTRKRRPTGSTAKRAGGARAGTGTKVRASAGKTTRPQVLPPKPRLPRSGKRVLDGLGVPVFGARHGAVERVDWSALAAEHRRHPVVSFLRHRRWVYATAATDRHLIALAIVYAGQPVTGTAFCMVTDLSTGETVVDSSRKGVLLPLFQVGDHPLDALSARCHLPGTDYQISTEPGSREVRIKVRLRKTAESLPGLRWVPGIRRVPVARDLPTASARPWVDVDLTLEPTVAPPITAVSRVDAHGGLVTSTMKTAAMNAWGTVTVHGDDPEAAPRTVSLDGGTGGLDYTNGFLPRHTHWRWAYTTGRLADGRLFGLNLVSEFSGIGDESVENAVWLDGALIPLDPKVRVRFDKSDLHQPWTVRTLDGSIHLSFAPLAVHDEALNLGVLRSKFVQPTGHYTGHVTVEGERIAIDRMPGVIEDQDILW